MIPILLIEDDKTFSRIVEGFLKKNDFEVTVTHDAQSGLKAFQSHVFALVLLDYRLPDQLGIEVLEQLKQIAGEKEIPVIMMTSFSDIRTAVNAMKAGAYEYITKPVNPDELLMLIKQALSSTITKPTTSSIPKDFIQGKSAVSVQLYNYVQLVAPTTMSVVIEGESGTGKENVARTIHLQSNRAKKPFVAVDCGALSKELAASELFGHSKGSFTGAIADKTGQIVAAEGGTLFLDEVGNLPYEVQIKLLRVLQERIVQPLGSTKEIKVDVRIITATNDDLHESVSKGSFREDLYHRLNEFKLKVPALRDRGEDLFEFLDFFRTAANKELGRVVKGFSDDVTELFKQYDWPGNLRELKNVVRRAVLLTQADTIQLEALPPEMVSNTQHHINKPAHHTTPASVYDLKAHQESKERDLIVRTLQDVRYNKSKAARLLNIDRKTLYLKMEKYGIE